jgi:hypothetical protein
MLLGYIVSQRGIEANPESLDRRQNRADLRHQGHTKSNRLPGGAKPFHFEAGRKGTALILV